MSESAENEWTIKRLLDWTTERFAKVDADSPRLEAEVLLAEALGCQRIQLYTQFDQVPASEPLAEFRNWVKRRASGEPVAYIVGHREFYSLRFDVNPQVLIPRPETEHVILAVLEFARTISDRPLRILDVGTGSGCIAITLAKQIDHCKVAALDCSAAALDVAKQNVERHQVADKVRCLQGDLFAALPTGSGPVHFVVSNPPYIGTDEVDTVDDQVKRFEPEIALFAGRDGMSVIRRLVAESPARLLPQGYLILEASPIIMDHVRAAIAAVPELRLVKVIKDFAGLERVVVAQKR